jgi:hypothetical protein
MKTLLQSPVLAALILGGAIVLAASLVATPRFLLDPGEGLRSGANIVVQAPNGFQVDVLGEVRIPAEMTLHADVKSEPRER